MAVHFLIPYMVVFLLLGLPLMWIEWTMGRYGGQYGHHSTPGIFDSMGRRRFWKYFGVFGLWSEPDYRFVLSLHRIVVHGLRRFLADERL